MLLPPGLPVLTTLGGLSEAQEWLSALPSLIADVAARWQLRLSPPLHGGSCSWVAPCETPDGTAAVVKIGWPHREMYGEPAALRAWAGRGAVRMLAHDPQRHALLLQRCDPGTELLAWPGDQLVTGCAVLRTLRDVPLPAGISSRPDEPGISSTRDQSGRGSPGNDLSQGIEPLAVVAAEWATRTQERMERLRPPYDPALVAAGVDLMRSLPVSAEGTVLLHGDFNPG